MIKLRSGLLAVVFIFSGNANADKPINYLTFEAQWDTFLQANVNPIGLINYAQLKENPEAINAAYQWISTYSPDSHPALFPNENSRFAYWLNAYNVAVIYGVVQHYPIRSVLEVRPLSFYSFFNAGGFFVAKKFKFGSKRISLYKLENKLIRKRFNDPRLHFALNCASSGCPRLPQTSFKASELDQQLYNETREFISNSKHYRIDQIEEEIQISAIFDWYSEDFYTPETKDSEKNVRLLAYLKTILPENAQSLFSKAIERGYTLTFIDYDWSLNDQ